MNAAAQYRQLLALGRDGFLAAAAPAALVRYRQAGEAASAGEPVDVDEATYDVRSALLRAIEGEAGGEPELDVFPLIKKPGASFPDRITIGRTANNDVAIGDASVSRLHAYVRRTDSGWVVADAGSKNGSWLRGEHLAPRKERPLISRALLRIGEIELTFYLAAELYAALGGRA